MKALFYHQKPPFRVSFLRIRGKVEVVVAAKRCNNTKPLDCGEDEAYVTSLSLKGLALYLSWLEGVHAIIVSVRVLVPLSYTKLVRSIEVVKRGTYIGVKWFSDAKTPRDALSKIRSRTARPPDHGNNLINFLD